MDDARFERWGAVCGFVSLALGGAAGALERGWPSGHDPVATAEFITVHRTAILAQSMLFAVSAAVLVGFLATLRTFLARTEGSEKTLSTIAYGAGIAWFTMMLLAQGLQIGISMAPSPTTPTALLWTMAAIFGLTNLPLAVALVAIAIVSFRHHAFPTWLAWITLLAASAQLLLFVSTVVDRGPLAPNGWLMYVLYPMFAVWLVPTAIVMLKRSTPPEDVGPIRRALVPQH